MDFVLIAGATGYFLYFIAKYLEHKREYRREAIELEREQTKWLTTEELLYRSYHTYPPDWHQRKLFVQKRDNYRCQLCGYQAYLSPQELKKAIETRRHTMWTGLHVHHKIPLSKGGDNSLENLISLCENCHENQHPHMLRKKIAGYKLKASRARKPANVAYWTNLAKEAEARLHQPSTSNF